MSFYDDEDVLENIRTHRRKKKTRPALATMLSRDNVDDFELEFFMNGND